MAGRLKILIAGGGPAGLSLAWFLRQSQGVDATVVEKASRIGGKSFSVGFQSGVVEFGTCYATRAHRTALGWMKQTGITIQRVGESHVDGVPLSAWIKQVGNEPLIAEAARYIDARRIILRRLAGPKHDPALLEMLAAPTQDWLDAKRLHKIGRLMLRIVTGMGYGRLDEVPLLHTLRWVDPDLLLSGVFHDVFMPVEGWSEFWNRLAAPMDVRTRTEIRSIDRSGTGAEVTFASGDVERYDAVVCAMPLAEFFKLTEPDGEELAIEASVRWGGFATTLAVVENWPVRKLEFFSEAVISGAKEGRLLSRRHEGNEPSLGGDLYILNQLPGSYSSAELSEILSHECARNGARLKTVIEQKIWDYFPQLEPQAIVGGVLSSMRAVQGRQSTWYTGATFSHEAISNIVSFNATLANQICEAASRKLKAEALQARPARRRDLQRRAASRG